MTRDIIIEEVAYPMRADGATAFLYKQCFNEDLIRLFTGAADGEEVDADGMGKKLAYVMTKQAEQPDPTKVKLSFNDFLLWVCKFEPLSLSIAGDAIIGLYVEQTKPTSAAKKKSEEQLEK